MKEIELVNAQGASAKVSDEDFGFISSISPWYLDPMGYASASYRGKPIVMHELILVVADGFVVDHKDRNRLNNQRDNLRAATQSQNNCNRGKPKNNTSGYKGVFFHKHRRKWYSQIMVDRKLTFLGYFVTKEDAAYAYDQAALKMHGEFAEINHVSIKETTHHHDISEFV